MLNCFNDFLFCICLPLDSNISQAKIFDCRRSWYYLILKSLNSLQDIPRLRSYSADLQCIFLNRGGGGGGSYDYHPGKKEVIWWYLLATVVLFLFIIYYELGMPSIKFTFVSVLVPIYMRVPVLNTLSTIIRHSPIKAYQNCWLFLILNVVVCSKFLL